MACDCGYQKLRREGNISHSSTCTCLYHNKSVIVLRGKTCSLDTDKWVQQLLHTTAGPEIRIMYFRILDSFECSRDSFVLWKQYQKMKDNNSS